jgi:cyclophilin family peptidyl-prolyl cis-trans isomerase
VYARSQARCFEDEIRLPGTKHNKAGLVCMASSGENQNASQFYITMRGEDMEVWPLSQRV